MRKSKDLAAAVTKAGGSHLLLGMGQLKHGVEFARKLRLFKDNNGVTTHELLVDTGPAFPLYKTLRLKEVGTLSKIYTETINLESLLSAVSAAVSSGGGEEG